MSIEIVCIGNEVLSGMTLNSNAAYLGESLGSVGWSVLRHTVLPDDPGIITMGLKEAIDRSCCVIVTGGLGPTIDDMTLTCAENLFEGEPHYFPNRGGSALGVAFKTEDKLLILLPGVPQEMQAMFEESVLPYLYQNLKLEESCFQEVFHLCLLKELEVDPLLRELKKRHPKLDIGIYPAYGTLTLKLRSLDKTILDDAGKQIKEAFKKNLFPSQSGKIEEAVHHWFTVHKKRLACAESCTGGLIASKLTAFPGASSYFLGSLVAYSNQLKENLLHVSSQTLEIKGAVSSEVVTEMLLGLFKTTGADWGIAVSGIAGPSGGSDEKPVGTVWYAIGERGKPPIVGTFLAKGNRQTITLQAANKPLGFLWQLLKH